MSGNWGESTVMARLRAGSPQLGPSERRVASVILARPSEVTDWSTSELAAAAETSAATVIRACQSLGFRGFQHLRLELARAAPSLPETNDDPVGVLFDEAVDALRVGRESVDPGAVEAAVRALEGARRLVLVGNGFSSPPLQDAALRFSTIGRSVEAPSDVLAQQFASHSLAPGDVCLAVSYSGANLHSLAACRAAADRGATVIVITSFARSPLARLGTIALVTTPVGSAHGIDPFLSRLNHMVILHALHSLLAQRIGSDVVEMRHVIAEALAEDE
ncbi:RpiR family transcriptional regulator [Glaciihabitans tibetensis]|uniref:RpiR family transcriptional regulator n=1 Tax=Glaciihabitans tibetensis TaxID=1266600 RepID=A0A2T0VC96_9MICO|nr:MurR/RpiR family transcriptional regulator [Glaciihabitans tibetensis]PRY67688.1 RpiR family transcriptional regulator [Glaciihabitans tibetensis]